MIHFRCATCAETPVITILAGLYPAFIIITCLLAMDKRKGRTREVLPFYKSGVYVIFSYTP